MAESEEEKRLGSRKRTRERGSEVRVRESALGGVRGVRRRPRLRALISTDALLDHG